MKKALYFLAVICFSVFSSGCKKDEPEAVDKFVETQSGTYQEWSCNSGGTAQLGITVENSSLSVKKTGPESAEITCSLPVIGQVFKCNATVQSDSSLIIPAFMLDGVMYDGKYVVRQSGSKFLNLYHPDKVCTLFGIRAGNIAWVKS